MKQNLINQSPHTASSPFPLQLADVLVDFVPDLLLVLDLDPARRLLLALRQSLARLDLLVPQLLLASIHLLLALQARLALT